MKKIIKFLSLFIITLLLFAINVNAKSTTYVNLSNFKISTNGTDYSKIKEYTSLEDFLTDYKADNLPEIYITTFLFDGVSAVTTPDLDDFIENDSNDTKIKTLEINVVNINTTGDIELTGTTKGTMIAVNTNNVEGDINLILNNVNIDTDTKKAPAIYVYNKSTTYTECNVTIKTKEKTKNYIEGGKLKKVSLVAKEKLSNYSSYYSGNTLTNYNKYTSYYGIYSDDEIENILFATVKADSEDLADGDPLYFYKSSGAISSDIDLTFEGEGYLEVRSKNNEGIETKGNLTFSGGTGDYVIYAFDDCLNTTTSSSTATEVRNNMVIDVNSLIAIVDDEGKEGDAIDSNGTLIINGGTIYAFANSNSEDSGLDSETGTYINGGTIISTGNMADQISGESNQNSIYVQFNNKISKDTLIVIKDQNDNILLAFKTSKDIQTLFYTDANLEYESYKIYTGGTIEGEEENGIYTNVESYTNGEEISYSEVNSFNISNDITNKSSIQNYIIKQLIVETTILVITLVLVYFYYKKQK